MNGLGLSRYALTIGVAAALLAGCSGSQLPIGAPGPTVQTSAAHAREAAVPNEQSWSHQILYDFNLGREGKGSGDPLGGLLDVDGALYGTTISGRGKHPGHSCVGRSCGTIFRITTAGAYKTIYAFHGGLVDGASPAAGFTDVGGTLYSTTKRGGSACDCGTVYSMGSAGGEKILYSFLGGSDGADPQEGNLIYVNGALYGTTPSGGRSKCSSKNGCGTVYSVTTSGQEQVLHVFGKAGDGGTPRWGLIDVNGTMYGTTTNGGAHHCGRRGNLHGCGTVYSITPSGVEKVLYSFAGGSDGETPLGGLIDVKGTLYGTTELGGTGASCGGSDPGCGTVYSITTEGTEKVLYSFRSGSDGRWPTGPLIDVKGTLYGTTTAAGNTGCTFGCGTVFSVTTDGRERVLYRFAGGTDGWQPNAPLISVNGTLYSTTSQGGTNNHGTIFALRP